MTQLANGHAIALSPDAQADTPACQGVDSASSTRQGTGDTADAPISISSSPSRSSADPVDIRSQVNSPTMSFSTNPSSHSSGSKPARRFGDALPEIVEIERAVGPSWLPGNLGRLAVKDRKPSLPGMRHPSSWNGRQGEGTSTSRLSPMNHAFSHSTGSDGLKPEQKQWLKAQKPDWGSNSEL
jgi:hypothetical protein